ncbi:MAG: hypothetical protein JW705_00820 [Methanosarcinaceae archaeon]|nr:hypothetical protein [Methanosarcinaceae archaeon]
MTVDTKVDGSGNLENYRLVLSTNSYMYGLLNSELGDDGMTLRERVESEGGTYSEEWDGEEVDIIIEDISSESIDIQVEDGYIIFRDEMTDFSGQASDLEDNEFSGMADGAIKVHYYLEMPGKIVDSNANTVDGNKAEWHMLDMSSAKAVYAKSEKPMLPGFGIAGTLLSLLVTLYLIRRV